MFAFIDSSLITTIESEVIMEEELKCVSCSGYYTDPVLLPCTHSVCSSCVTQCLEPFILNSEDGSSTSSSSGDLDCFDVDKMSIVSEADSGVVCNSRPSSYISSASIGNLSQNSSHHHQNAQVFRCPVCKRPVFVDETGPNCLPKNRIMEGIVEKYIETKHITKCQLCEDKAKEATVYCEQCAVYYCDNCRENCHPSRGPLAKHNLTEPNQNKNKLQSRRKSTSHDHKCKEHSDEILSMYCTLCKTGLCYLCAQDPFHAMHDVQALGAMSKAIKTELSQNLQVLSERARAGTEFIQRLKAMSEQTHENCAVFESNIVHQCDALIDAIEQRKQNLLTSIAQERDHKVRILKEQVQHCTSLLQRTTGLLQFCIEVLKESDALSFLQTASREPGSRSLDIGYNSDGQSLFKVTQQLVSSGLIHRVCNSDQIFNKNVEFKPRTSPEFELTLDNSGILHAINTLNFFQLKAPGPPAILPKECSAENNSVTIVWQPYLGSVVEAYTLELDDGNGGDYRVVYIGREMMCTVDGLHFNSIYNARVKAHNHCGESVYSQCISLHTAEVAWFMLDLISAHPDVMFSNNNLTIACNNFEPRVVLGSVGLSKGVHYWEWKIDRYDSQADPSFGIARFDVSKDQLLGKDDKSWAMYVDHQRSWFMHHDTHSHRTDGGINQGSVIGVLLDLNKHTLSYYINDEPHGPVAFNSLHGVFFPAVSINRGVQVTLRTGLVPPMDSESEEE